MKKGMTIQEAAAEIMRQSEAKTDYLVNTQHLHMETCDGVPTLRLLDAGGVDRVEPLDMLTEAKVLSYLRRALLKQTQAPERDVVALVKRNDQFVYKAYSAKMRRTLTREMQTPAPVYQAVLENEPERFPGFERLLRRKRREYEN